MFQSNHQERPRYIKRRFAHFGCKFVSMVFGTQKIESAGRVTKPIVAGWTKTDTPCGWTVTEFVLSVSQQEGLRKYWETDVVSLSCENGKVYLIPCEGHSFKHFPMVDQRSQKTDVSCNRWICNKTKWVLESHLLRFSTKYCKQWVSMFFPKSLLPSSSLPVLRKTNKRQWFVCASSKDWDRFVSPPASWWKRSKFENASLESERFYGRVSRPDLLRWSHHSFLW